MSRRCRWSCLDARACAATCRDVDEDAEAIAQAEADRDHAEPGAVPSEVAA